MQTLVFRGYGDDTFGEYGVSNTDVESPLGDPIACVIVGDGTALIVTGQYSRVGGGTWDIGISLYNDEVPYPDWAKRLRFEDYSTVLELDVPDTVELKWFRGNNEVIT